MSNQQSPILQRSENWKRKRLGKFTSSMAYVFIPNSKKEGEPNDTAKKYIMQNLWELLTGEQKEIKAYALTWGNEWEAFAKKAVQDKYKSEFFDCELIQHPELPYLAGSPDGSISINGMEYTVETKCPVGVEHLVNIGLFSSVEALKKGYPELYWQVQQNMYLMGTKISLGVSFHHQADSLMYKDIHVEYNSDDMNILLAKMNEGWEWMKKQAELLGIDILAKYAEYSKPLVGGMREIPEQHNYAA